MIDLSDNDKSAMLAKYSVDGIMLIVVEDGIVTRILADEQALGVTPIVLDMDGDNPDRVQERLQAYRDNGHTWYYKAF